MRFPIGVLIDSFRCPLPQALERAAALGMQGIQIYATSGEMAPENLTQSQRRELRDRISSAGLAVSALCGDLGKGFGDAARNPALLERSKRIVELGKDLGTDVVTTHIGVVPSQPSHPRYQVMQEACGRLAAFADSMEAHFAVETGPEPAATLKGFLDSLHSTGVAVNLDPANFVMVTGDDPVQAVHTLKDYIVHTHAKDGRRLQVKDPEIIYGLLEEELQSGESFVELPLGRGDVDFPGWLKALEEIGYRGYLTIERETGSQPEEDIRLAAAYLKSLMK